MLILIVSINFVCYYLSMSELRKNDIFIVTIDGYNSDAMGVCRIDGRAVFVPGTVMGEVWEIKILKVASNAVYAKALNCISSSARRVIPECAHFGKCGGCNCWHMSYEEELNFKISKVNDAFRRIGQQSLKACEIIGADSLYSYRNKGILAVSKFEGKPRAGFYRQRSHQLIAAEDCLIQNELCLKCAKIVCCFMEKHNFLPYDEESGKGIVRHIFCRRAHYSSDAVLCIVAAKGFGDKTSALVDMLLKECPELSGIVLNINKTRGNTVLGGDFYTLWGRSCISDILCGFEFEIAPQAFYQINPRQAKKLYSKALEYAALEKDDIALDLYCGAGTISLCLAEKAAKVIGAEIVQQSIDNAKENAKRNNVDNIEFICADAGDAAMMFTERGIKPKVIVVDPPRKGMAKSAVEAVAAMMPERIVYISCNCATQARDILLFNMLGYEAVKACAVDMFPRTSHVETVVLLSRIKQLG